MTGLRTVPSGLQLTVRLTPNASADRIEGWIDGSDGESWLKVRVRAIPEDGKANTALIKLLAKQAGLAKNRLTLVRGHSHRLKTIEMVCEAGERANIAARLGAGTT
ncbi:DUF167 domain-containing protein [Hyphobacterium sp. HN65]|uniref:UPF0235 protein V0U79_11390 n=1 Tax=Hyphobacterium lacteum TaxID=3116575 RepID=A0ABU7LTR8_9PROT|nr:DUF167 domain-containing protein [Hyphobacterium sp. HN65]MEE2526974.1 DUF167 domain-containing protein [Hyphobacterium sp. HN65]